MERDLVRENGRLGLQQDENNLQDSVSNKILARFLELGAKVNFFKAVSERSLVHSKQGILVSRIDDPAECLFPTKLVS